jgi:hypothetical protein
MALMKIRSAHQHVTVFVHEVGHECRFEPGNDGRFYGTVPVEVGEKLRTSSPQEYQCLAVVQSEEAEMSAETEALTDEPSPAEDEDGDMVAHRRGGRGRRKS